MPELISLKQARLSGLPNYYTGKPCPKGHIGQRVVSKRCCEICRNKKVSPSKSAVHFSRRAAKQRGDKFYFTGKPCKNGHVVNRETKTGQCLNCVKNAITKWRSNNFAKVKSSYAAYKRNNRGRVNANNRSRQLRKQRATPQWSEKELIRSVYDGADYLSRLTGIQWDVDHIVPINNQDVCGLHVLNNLQYLPHTDNVRKGSKHG